MVDKNIYWKGAAIALILFLISVSIGYYLESIKYKQMTNEINALNLEIDSSSTMLLFVQTIGYNKSNCKTVTSALEPMSIQVSQLREKLERGKSNIFINYNNLRSLYYLTNLKLFLLTNENNLFCHNKKNTILFFYNADNVCPSCVVQGKILNDIKKDFKEELYIFAFPYDIENPAALNMLKAYYTIKSAPSVVINGEILNGLQSEKKIRQKLK